MLRETALPMAGVVHAAGLVFRPSPACRVHEVVPCGLAEDESPYLLRYCIYGRGEEL
jgi:hypothetical protein